MIFVILWTIIFAFLAVYLGKSPRVRSWLKVIFRAPKLWRTIIGSVALVTTIVVTYLIVPKAADTQLDERSLFEDYAAIAVMKLDSLQVLKVDNDCNLSHPEPELAYVLPLVLGAYNEIVDKPTTPVITRLDDTLYLTMNGYKQFKNRGIRLNKLLQKKLGKRYKTQIESEGSSHTLIVTYTGEPWDTEQLMALPVMEASQINKLDPALLMSLIQHVSNFNFNFHGQKDSKGLLALKEGEGLEQIFIGAERLGKMLQVGVSHENAVATFYPNPEINSKPENWSKSPLTKSWVDQVLSDVEFYHANGLSHFVR
ncbi:hypothetical protein SAMN05720473_11611 [Fibrobacter sp. UWB15]|uniref:hypothetical protein n=1 Tax=unclassified Fibrobacter TaxID=2634177 RepID=UPI000921A86B|nr:MULTISPECIES: hypothetical protein [unclassified Fibrobacter]PWJ61521.1 hypothetical protein BGW99_11711 [Fibrobacter sp. UWB6]SHG64478.1 hypothetical protein SAMN05720760_1199 [Fibrobacter sp. UWB8]SMG44080.1 hypothetical protein SAMN05720473_11611 [Fibrobacter sp. UWB15]